MAAAALPLTPTRDFFVRAHFPIPRVDASSYRLRVGGLVRRELALALDELRSLPSAGTVVTLECAGNGRSLVEPRPPGTPWRLGAFGTALFEGTPLAHLLARAEPLPDARFVVFFGADEGEVEPGRRETFARAIPLAEALVEGPMLAWSMNGHPLPSEHGRPLRGVVPGRYGVDSVKWLTRIELRSRPFEGYFQADRYRYIGQDGVEDGAPVARMRPRSLIGHPAGGARLSAGVATEIAGSAWSGEGSISRVDVSVDGGRTWSPAELGVVAGRFGPTPWRFAWTPERPGPCVLLARATDAAGDVQPLEGAWNALGYGNNAVQRVLVDVARSGHPSGAGGRSG